MVGDILVKEGRSVIWCTEGGNKHVRQFSCPSEPLDAIFCSFPSISDEIDQVEIAVAILLTRDHLCLHQTNGESFDISLDFNVECMFAASEGLLLQSGGEHTGEQGCEIYCNLYALPHPVTLVRPVIMRAMPSYDNEDSMIVDSNGSILGNIGNDSAMNLSLRNFSSPTYNLDESTQYHYNDQIGNRVVGVLDNIVITCQRSEACSERSSISVWILQPLIISPDDAEKMDSQQHAYPEATDTDGLPPLPPSLSQTTNSRSFRSLSDGRHCRGVQSVGVQITGTRTNWRGATVPRCPHSSPQAGPLKFSKML